MQQIFKEQVFNVPNILTLIRIALLPVVAWCFKMGHMAWAFAVYLAAMLTDAFDGAIARKTNQITTLGKLLDPIADKLSLLTLLGLFVGDGQIPLWVLIVMIFKETIMVIGSSVAFKNGIVVYALPIGKVTTVTFILSIVARFVQRTQLADVLMYISVALSMAALFWYTRNVMIKLEETKSAKARVIE